jgi:hypothetical protein
MSNFETVAARGCNAPLGRSNFGPSAPDQAAEGTAGHKTNQPVTHERQTAFDIFASAPARTADDAGEDTPSSGS